MKWRFFLATFLLTFPFTVLALEVTATIFPMYWLLTEIMSGVAKPNVLDINTSIHDYQLTPNAAKLLESSNLVFYVSKNFEPFAKKLHSVNWIEVIAEIPEDEKIGNDIHMWLDPGLMQKVAMLMARLLTNLDEKNKDLYVSNARALVFHIDECVKKIKKMLGAVRNVNYAVSHDAYLYFTDYFDIPLAIKLSRNNDHLVSIKSIQLLRNMERSALSCIILDSNHMVKVPNDVLLKNKVINIDPLGRDVMTNSYTDFLLGIAYKFQECFK